MSMRGFMLALARGARGKELAKAFVLPDNMALFAKAGTGLPEGYTKLAGITYESATYYKITDFLLTGADTMKFSFTATKACNVIGCYTTTSAQTNYSMYASTSSGAKYMRYNGGTYNSQIVANKKYDVVITPTGATGLDQTSTWEQKDFTCESDLCIGTTSPSASSAKLDGTLYGDIVVEGRLHLVPCKRDSDNVVGYYDLKSKTFYEPTGSAPTPVAE